MKIVKANGGKMMFWQDHGGGWYWRARRPWQSYAPKEINCFRTTDGKPVFIAGHGSHGEGHSPSLSGARRAALSVCR